MLVYWMIWYCYLFLFFFQVYFQLYSSVFYISLYGYRYHVTLYIGQQHSTTVYRTGFWMCVVMVLSVIRCFCYFLFDRILFNHHFHHNSCDYHWDFMSIHNFLNYILGFLYLSSYSSANAQLPGCFRPWTFPLNIGLNMLPLDSFMSYLHTLLGYPTWEFQALQLIVLAAFGAVDWPFVGPHFGNLV